MKPVTGFFAEKSAKSLPENSFLNARIPFTNPVICTGKAPTIITRGSNKYAEVAKNTWYVEFYFYDDYHEKMVRIRQTKQLNRIKEYSEKLTAFRELQTSCINDLREGWNPLEIKPEIKTHNTIPLDDAIQRFISYHKAKGTRRTSIDAYTSKLKLFREHMGNGRVDKIDDYDITNFLDSTERERKWTGVTYNYAKIVLNNFFVYLKKYRFVSQNPTDGLERRKEVKTETHQVFSDSDFVIIMKWLRANIELTKKLKSAGQFLDLPILEHIILTKDAYFSFADEGLM